VGQHERGEPDPRAAGPLVLSAFVTGGYYLVWIAVICGTPPVRALAVLDAAILVFAVRIFSGLSQLDVAAVGHLTAALTAAAMVAVILIRRGRRRRSGHVDADADQVGDPGGGGSQHQLS
jgi:hypothetical protein